MPKDYLKQISERLEIEGVNASPTKVKDILRGRSNNIELTIHIEQIVKEIAKKHQEHLRRIRKIQKSLKKI